MKNTHMHPNVNKGNAFKRKKLHYSTDIITLLTSYWHMRYRIIASGQMGTKSTVSSAVFSFPGHARLPWEPIWRRMVVQYSQIDSIGVNRN